MTGNSSHLTPNFNAGNSQNVHNKDDQGERDGNAKEQRHEQSKEKSDQSDKQDQKTGKEKRNVEGGKSVQGQRSNGNQPDQARHTYKQGGGNSDTQIDRESEEYHNNFPKISNNHTRYDPNAQTDERTSGVVRVFM